MSIQRSERDHKPQNEFQLHELPVNKMRKPVQDIKMEFNNDIETWRKKQNWDEARNEKFHKIKCKAHLIKSNGKLHK